MKSLICSVLLSSLAIGTNAHQHQHGHAHLHARAIETEIVTDIVLETVYVYPDGKVLSTAASTSFHSIASAPSQEAVFFQLDTSESSTNTTTSPTSTSTSTSETSTSTSSVAVTPTLPSTTLVTIPSSTPEPTTSTPSIVIPSVVHVVPSVVTPTVETPAYEAPVVPGERTFTVVNLHTAAVSTQHDDTSGTPTSAGSPLKAGTMAAGATATFAVPKGWVGNIALSDAKFGIGSDATLIEGNFVEWFATPGIARADFDISFVNGFTLPAVCSCGGTVTTGCNLDLNALASCPSGITSGGACANPLRSSFVATSASSFFAPCEGAAWTFVNDGNADSNCESGKIECCIGTACPPNPKQG